MFTMKTQAASRLALLFILSAVRGSVGCFNTSKNSSRNIKSGDTFYQECICSENDQSVDSLRWIDPDGQEISFLNGPGTESVVFTEKNGRSLSLYIAYVSKSRAGTYSCVGESGGRQHSLNYHITAYDPLYFVDPMESQFLIKGKDSVIKCEARGETDPFMTWYKGTDDDMVQLSDDEKYEQVPEGLKVKQVSEGDEGRYRCTALVLETGEEEEQTIDVEVLTKPFIESILAKPDRTVVIGDPLTVECIGLGVPTLVYSWNKTSETRPKQLLEWPKTTKKLVFDSVKADDAGVYECVASNRAGTASETVSIEVFIPPRIEAFKNVTGAEGSIVHLICNAFGRPAPTINIVFEREFDATEISVVNLNVSETENSLVVSFFNLSRRYEGNYFCYASNKVATANAEASVTVHHKPYFNSTRELFWGWIGLTLNLSCPHESNPPAEIQWWYQVNSSWPEVELPFIKNKDNYYLSIEKEKSAYGMYKCIASNYLGNSTKLFLIRPGFLPSEVTNITVLEVMASSVIFDLEIPQNYQGPEVIGFTCEYDEVGNYERTSIHNNRSWAINVPFRVEKMKPMTKYRFKFAAINAMGHGNWSAAIEIETPEKSVPDQPIWIESNETKVLDNGNLIVRWKTPENNGEPIDVYLLQYCPFIGEELDEDSCNIMEIASSRTEFDLTGVLESNRTYEILLAAHNLLGNSSGAVLILSVPMKILASASSAHVIIGLSVLAVVAGILALDLLLFFWKRQGMIASCYFRNKKKNENNTLSRDKKGLLKDNDPSVAEDTLKRSGNGEKNYEFTQATGIITGKHSSV